jgi:hypothetical protein
VFSFAAIAALAIWVTPSTRDRVIVLGGDPATSRTIATLVRAGDWFARFRIDASGPPGSLITVADRDGTTYTGWPAARLVLSRLPLTFPLVAPLLLPARLRRLRHAEGVA